MFNLKQKIMKNIQNYLDYICLILCGLITIIKIYSNQYELANVYGTMFIWVLRTIYLEHIINKK